MWTTLSFKFPASVLATADKETVFREFDQWFMPEGHATSSAFSAPPAAPAIAASPAATPVASAAPQPIAATRPATPRDSTLAPGMTSERILQVMGTPERDIHFDPREWMIYPGFVAVTQEKQT